MFFFLLGLSVVSYISQSFNCPYCHILVHSTSHVFSACRSVVCQCQSTSLSALFSVFQLLIDFLVFSVCYSDLSQCLTVSQSVSQSSVSQVFQNFVHSFIHSITLISLSFFSESVSRQSVRSFRNLLIIL